MRQLTGALLALAMLAWGTPALAADEINVSVTTTTWSQYSGINGMRVYHKPVQQTDVFISLPKGFYADAWWSTGFDKDFSSDFGDEVDWTVGWSGPINKFGLVVDTGVAYFDLFQLAKTSDDIIQPYIKVTRPFSVGEEKHHLRPFVKFDYAHPTSGEGAGTNVHVGIEHDWAIRPNLTLSHKVFALHDSGIGGAKRGFVGHYEAALAMEVRKGVQILLPQAKLSTPLSSLEDRSTEAAIGVGLRIAF